ncbi:MAG TPA: TonB-dependent receptor [Terracidiphilus sp.]|nr:TonB-dependent receptor [Terracidiphilus sp.]
MKRRGLQRMLLVVITIGSVLALASSRAAAQSGSQGKVQVMVEDASGAIVPQAALKLVALRTNDTRTATGSRAGTYTFVNLPIGLYQLTISAKGFATKVYSSVLVEASRTTTLTADLSVGETSQTVRVDAETSPVLEVSSNAIGTVVDMKQIEDLPIDGRDLTSLIGIVPGFSGANGRGTFNGLPSTDQGNNIDGVIGSASRMKFTGNLQPAVSPRLEDIEQMSVQTDQLDLNSGFGQATTQVNFVSRRGSNNFHGRAYEDFRNSGLNANSWYNDALGLQKNKLIMNDFGGSVGGPILRDKLFFFGTFAMRKVPGSFTATNNVFTSDAQQGNFTYTGTDGQSHTYNLLTIAQNSGLGIPSTVNSDTAAQFSAINSSVGTGTTTPTSNPNFNEVGWTQSSPTTYYYPVARIDYNASEKARMYLSWMMTKLSQPAVSQSPFPGSAFNNQIAGNQTKNFTSSYGFDYIISPQLINQFKMGFLYDATGYAYNAAPIWVTEPSVAWNFPGANGLMSGQQYNLPVSTYYPIYTISDSMTLQRGKHTIQYGMSAYREQDHYWNPPAGFNNYSLGLATGDPALNAFTNSGSNATLPAASNASLQQADQLYAILVGRISSVNGESPYNISKQAYNTPGQTGEYPLNERVTSWGLFAEDSWKITPTLTLNYGLRWDFVGASKDLTGFYHSASEAAIYGPSGVGNLFNPGTLGGDMNPAITEHSQPYNPWRMTPQPAFGFAWNPRPTDGAWKRLLGGSNTVIRGGFALRRFTEPYQYFWDYATDYGSFYYQYFYLNANNTGQTGTFAPGSLSLGDTLPSFGLSPSSYQASAPESEFTFLNSTPVNGIQPNLHQPYSESWNIGIQRAFGRSLALEVRYNGNRTIHQWVGIDPNEVNIFENGFLQQFKNAQANLAASGGTSFSSSYGNATPIFDDAFGGSNASDYTNAQFINYLNTGQAGAMASVLANVAGTVPYFCNLVGSSFSPCATNAGYTGAGAGYPINFFVANPYASGTGYPANATGELVSAGYSNYNALQLELRQNSWHGLQYDANYTWSKSLGVASNNQWTGAFNAFTLRNLRQSYGPTVFDIRNVFHANGTYDLPFGRGRAFLSQNRVLDKVVGGFTLGSIVTWQSGAPTQLVGGYNTFNDYGDGGVRLNGVTVSQLQHSVGVYHVPGQAFVDLINPKYLSSASGGGANSQYITPNTTPGTIGQVPYLHGPKQFYQDLSITKSVPIHDALNFKLQAAFMNVWNHPVFGYSSGGNSFNAGVQAYGFGLGSPTNENSGETPGFGRTIELRGNFEF